MFCLQNFQEISIKLLKDHESIKLELLVKFKRFGTYFLESKTFGVTNILLRKKENSLKVCELFCNMISLISDPFYCEWEIIRTKVIYSF